MFIFNIIIDNNKTTTYNFLGSHITATSLKNTSKLIYFPLFSIISPMKKEPNFKANTPHEPAGDQPTAIKN